MTVKRNLAQMRGVFAGRKPEPLAEQFGSTELAMERLINAELLKHLCDFVEWHGKRGGPSDNLLPADEQEPEIAAAMAAIQKAVKAIHDRDD